MRVRLIKASGIDVQKKDPVIKAMVKYGKVTQEKAEEIVEKTMRVGFSPWYEFPIPEAYLDLVKAFVFTNGFELQQDA